MRTVIGLDYGTQSARAVLADVETGEVLMEHSLRYPHGVMEGSLASIRDYQDAFDELIAAVTPEKYRATVAGICVDATSLTLVPVDRNGCPLALLPRYEKSLHAQIKLWKRHTAQSQVDEALALARQRGEKFLMRTGGSISSEWTLPKLLEIRDEDFSLYQEIDLALDLCEYFTCQLTGTLVRSVGSMAFKGLWARDLGLPEQEYLNELRPGFGREYANLMRGPVLQPGAKAGTLKPEMCEKFGLNRDVAIATGVLDGHTSVVSLGALNVGDVALVLGTSNVINVQTENLCEMEGVCGVARDGMIEGLYGVDSGQACTGDMLEWYMENMLPVSVWREAQEKGVSPHQLLAERVSRTWENELTITDWWNGSRNAPCDLNLRGGITGLSLETKPEDIYLALLQSIVCGSRRVLEVCESYGASVKRVVASGGIAGKNPLLMQEYANILGKPVYVGQVKEGPALGAAIYAAVAAGIYSSVNEAYEHMGVHDFVCYKPDMEHRAEYEALYQRNAGLRNMLAEA